MLVAERLRLFHVRIRAEALPIERAHTAEDRLINLEPPAVDCARVLLAHTCCDGICFFAVAYCRDLKPVGATFDGARGDRLSVPAALAARVSLPIRHLFVRCRLVGTRTPLRLAARITGRRRRG